MNSISTCFGHLYSHHQEIRLRSTAYSCLSCCSCCDAGESDGKMCALCGECCHPTLQHDNSYNRTVNYRQWNAVRSPDDGHKDAQNMLRYYWLPTHHYLLHLVGFSFTYLSKMHGHSNVKFVFIVVWSQFLEIVNTFIPVKMVQKECLWLSYLL